MVMMRHNRRWEINNKLINNILSFNIKLNNECSFDGKILCCVGVAQTNNDTMFDCISYFLKIEFNFYWHHLSSLSTINVTIKLPY